MENFITFLRRQHVILAMRNVIGTSMSYKGGTMYCPATKREIGGQARSV